MTIKEKRAKLKEYCTEHDNIIVVFGNDDAPHVPEHRRAILDKAIQCVCSDRDKQYGSPQDSFKEIAEYWSLYLGKTILPEDVGLMMALLKIARMVTGQPKEDSYVDACGYIACAGEIALKGGE